jgi:hypothetical protein
MKKIYVLFIALTAISVSFISCGSSGSGPGDVIIKSFDYLESQDYAKIAGLYATGKGELLTEEEQKKIEGMMGMAAQEHDKKGGVKDIIIVEENISDDGETAKVKYTIIYNDDSEVTENGKLIKVNGKWYMSLQM